MNYLKARCLPGLALLILMLPGAGPVQAETSYPILEIEDGDTLILEVAGRNERVQLLGIDAPEDAENAKFNLDLKRTGLSPEQLMALGESATTHLHQLAPVGSVVRLEGELDARDKYGRIPAKVFNADNRPLAEAMVQDGYAVGLPSDTLESDYMHRLDRLERFARKRQDGLWGSHAESVHVWYNQTR